MAVYLPERILTGTALSAFAGGLSTPGKGNARNGTHPRPVIPAR